MRMASILLDDEHQHIISGSKQSADSVDQPVLCETFLTTV